MKQLSYRPRVWAPNRRRVDLVLLDSPPGSVRELGYDQAFSGESHRIPMETEPGGWWVCPVELAAGERYGFSLDGADPRPDPRSRYQPEGVHSWSEVWLPDKLDHGSWAGTGVIDKVFYELHVGTFTPEGTFRAAQEKLPYLRDLGIEVIELMPVSAFEGNRGWGYDLVSLFAVHAAYGGPEGLAQFVAAAHREGMAVCMDTVLNHAGTLGCYLNEFAPYLNTEPQQWGCGYNLSAEGEVCEFLSDAALWWLKAFDIDALRLDAVHAIAARDREILFHRLRQQVTSLQKRSRREVSLVAESDLNQASMLETLELDGLWNDDFHHALHALFTGETHGYYRDFAPREALVKVLRDTYFHNHTYSSFRRQIWGEVVSEEVDPRRFVVFSANHDQVGNRPHGDRPSANLDDLSLAAMAALTLLSAYTPLLFMGEEFAATTPFLFFAAPLHPDDQALVRDGRQQEFAQAWEGTLAAQDAVPDPTDLATFEASKLSWEPTARGERMLGWYRDLLALRRRQRRGEFAPAPGQRHRAAWLNDVLVMEHAGIRVLVNFGSEPIATTQRVLMNWNERSKTIPAPDRSSELIICAE